MLALIVLDGTFHAPQDLLTGLADRRAKGGCGGRGIPVKDAPKVLVRQIPLRLQPAPGQESVGDTHAGGAAERCPDVERIILLQKGTVNDGKDLPLVLRPVVCRQLLRQLLQLVREGLRPIHAKGVLQSLPYRRIVLGLELPEIGAAGLFSATCVRDIKHVTQPQLPAAAVYQGNALGPLANVPAHPLIPEVILGAGGGLRALGIDHQLLMVGVFIEPGSGGEKGRPRPVAAGDLPGGLVCQLRIELGFYPHGHLLLPCSNDRWGGTVAAPR